MIDETIVAAFDSAADAQAAARDVEAAVPEATVTTHAGETVSGTTTTLAEPMPRKEPGFWSKLFGLDEDDSTTRSTGTLHDHTVYDRTLAGGGTVLTVKIADVERDGHRVLSILEGHNPIDIDERASSYAGDTVATGYAAPATGTVAEGLPSGTQTVQLAEEALQVGKRVVNRGTTRIRRYVVETPVSEDVALRNESVSVERRPVSGAATVGADAFTDKTIEVTEMNEEAVVGKTARVVEEVVIRKDVNDRVETVRDTVRHEELKVEKTDETPKVAPKTI